jgi:hypothetical protein
VRVHNSKPVKDWQTERAAQIKEFYLPSDRQDLNPEEKRNADLK